MEQGKQAATKTGKTWDNKRKQIRTVKTVKNKGKTPEIGTNKRKTVDKRGNRQKQSNQEKQGGKEENINSQENKGMEIIFLFETNYGDLHHILNEIQLHNSRHIVGI